VGDNWLFIGIDQTMRKSAAVMMLSSVWLFTSAFL
jgi:hypothetical protein